MRIIKRAVICSFILAIVVFGIAQIRELVTRDTTIPQIISDTDYLEITCNYTQEQLLEGISAYDDTDGDLTSAIIVSDLSRFIEPGVCNVTYVVFDSSNQAATLIRQVEFTDYQSPRLYLTKPMVFEVGEGTSEKAIERLSASDPLSGDLTDRIIQTDSNVSYQEEGSYYITYEVTNSYGDAFIINLPVHVVSSEAYSVDIVLTENIVYITAGTELDPKSYIKEVYNAQGESLDAGIVSAESSVDTQNPGTYEIHYLADDGAGHTGETWLTVVVQEAE